MTSITIGKARRQGVNMTKQEANEKLAKLHTEFTKIVKEIKDLCDEHGLQYYPGLGVYPEVWYVGANFDDKYDEYTEGKGWVSSAHSC